MYNLTEQVTVHMLQQQRATIEVHLSVGDPGSPQAIASSLKWSRKDGEGNEERKYQNLTHTHTHTHTSLLLSAGKWKEEPPVWHNDFSGKQ